MYTELNDLNISKSNPSNKTQIFMFLSLMLLILSFFILLQSLSEFEDKKKKTVINSIDEKFKISPELLHSPKSIESRIGDIIQDQTDLEVLGDLFKEMFELSKVDFIDNGSTLMVYIPEAELFNPSTYQVRADKIGLLDRVADILTKKTQGQYYKLDFTVIRPETDYSEQMQRQDIAKAGALARSLEELHVPSPRFSIGIEVGNDEFVRFLFHTQSLKIKELNQESFIPHYGLEKDLKKTDNEIRL